MKTMKVVTAVTEFVITVGSDCIDVLKDASEKYRVHIPDAKFRVTFSDGVFEVYYGLMGCDRSEWAGWIPWVDMSKAGDTPIETLLEVLDFMHLMKRAGQIVADSLNHLHWEDILTEYLSGKGIDHEGQ